MLSCICTTLALPCLVGIYVKVCSSANPEIWLFPQFLRSTVGQGLSGQFGLAWRGPGKSVGRWAGGLAGSPLGGDLSLFTPLEKRAWPAPPTRDYGTS